MELEFVDRHAEHVDSPDDDLCDHGSFRLYPGDLFKGEVQFGQEVIAKITLEYVSKKKIRLIVDHLDYLIAKAKRVDGAP